LEKQLTCFLVVGRMGKSLTCSKAEPFAFHPSIGKIYIFSEERGFPLPKTVYITLPEWIVRLKPRVLYKFVRVISEPVQLFYFALKLKPDLINGYHLIPKGINSLMAARLTGSKCIISVIGGIVEIETYSSLKWFLKRLNIWALKRADLVTTKGSVVNAYLGEHNIPSGKIIVYNGSINLKKFYYDPSATKDIDVLFVGTFRSLKGPDRVLQVLGLLKKEFPKIKAYMIGQGSMYSFCVDLARTLNIDENVMFTGQVDEPAGYFQRSRILILPSTSEGLPTSMLEAMACGCIPVVSDVGNIHDVVKHAENAFLVPGYKNYESFAAYISMLLADEILRDKIIKDGLATVKNGFSIKHQAEIVDLMIQKLFKANVSI
jgi:glycosyltransferase involved in cell wall biosynthesis